MSIQSVKKTTSFVGKLYVPTDFEEGRGPRTYQGADEPNGQNFIPAPRHGDRYLQAHEQNIIEWVYTSANIWVELNKRNDEDAPQNTNILEII